MLSYILVQRSLVPWRRGSFARCARRTLTYSNTLGACGGRETTRCACFLTANPNVLALQSPRSASAATAAHRPPATVHAMCVNRVAGICGACRGHCCARVFTWFARPVLKRGAHSETGYRLGPQLQVSAPACRAARVSLPRRAALAVVQAAGDDTPGDTTPVQPADSRTPASGRKPSAKFSVSTCPGRVVAALARYGWLNYASERNALDKLSDKHGSDVQ